MSRMMEIVCHRGANEYAPENTYSSAKKCIAWGVDYVEIDVNTSRDGVMYLFHGPDVDRRTHAMGMFGDLTSSIIDTLDAGSWFSPEFAGERIPRLDAFLRWIKNKARVFFDVKAADHRALVDLIYALGFEKDCFFWSADDPWALRLREIDPQLPVKINVRNPRDVLAAHRRFRADIVEVGLAHMSAELLQMCRDHGMKVMIYHPEKDCEAFRKIIGWQVEMINLNHADVFMRVAKEMGVR